MASEVVIELGERTFAVRALPVGRAKAWREAFAEEIEGVLGAVQYAGQAMSAQIGNGAELGNLVAGLGGALLSQVGPTLLHSPDRMLDMVCEYAPNVAAERGWVEENAYDEEVMGAFLEVLKLAYPFGGIMRLVQGGQGSPGTRKS